MATLKRELSFAPGLNPVPSKPGRGLVAPDWGDRLLPDGLQGISISQDVLLWILGCA